MLISSSRGADDAKRRFRPGTGVILTARVAALLALVPTPARATVVEGLDLPGKVDATPVIVHGVVERVAAGWAEPGQRIRTTITLVVVTSFKGDIPPGDRLQVQRGGGTVDGMTQTAPGLSTYEVGEEVVMFLEPLGASYVAIGIGIGKYEIRNERGERWVHHAPHVQGLSYRTGQAVVEPILPMSPEPVDDFFKRIRTLVARPSAADASTQKRRPGRRLRAPLPLPDLPSAR